MHLTWMMKCLNEKKTFTGSDFCLQKWRLLKGVNDNGINKFNTMRLRLTINKFDEIVGKLGKVFVLVKLIERSQVNQMSLPLTLGAAQLPS